MEDINLTNLTSEQRDSLMKQLAAQQQQEKQKKEEEKRAYKELANETVETSFVYLSDTSKKLKEVKKMVFDNFKSVLDLKKDLFNIEGNQASHTFTSTDGKKRITIGYRTNDNYDDTCEAGIEKVKNYLKSLAQDEKTGSLVEIITELLTRDKSGNLKPSRVMKLYQHAMNSGNADFIEGVDIIQKAYNPQFTKTFITAAEKNEQGEWIAVPLSMTDN